MVGDDLEKGDAFGTSGMLILKSDEVYEFQSSTVSVRP